MATTTDRYIYGAILKRAEETRTIPNKTQEARDWFRKSASKYTNVNQDRLFSGATLTDIPLLGRMYMYVYDAKTKDKLPYWDAFPLIFHVESDSTGFYGINLHYLAPRLRANLMDALYTTINNKKYDDSTKLNISYGILKQASSMRLFAPCFKRYLFSQVKSRMIYIPPAEWDISLFLPTQRFKKAPDDQVWRESSEKAYRTTNTRNRKRKK
jgi:hypothetical protein